MISGAAIARYQSASFPVDRHAFAIGDEPQVRQAAARDAVFPPAMDGRRWRICVARHGAGASQRVNDGIGNGAHEAGYATIANYPQAGFCDNRDCDNRTIVLEERMGPEEIKAELDRRNMSQRDLAQAIGMDENHLSKALNHKRQFKTYELDAIRAELAPPPEDDERLPVKSIPWLGDVPAGSFQPQEQRGGRRMLVADPDVPPSAYGLTVKGDSMDLIVPTGSSIVVDAADKQLFPGFRYVVRTADGETTFKEYQDGPARLVPCSSNPEHKEILLGSEPVMIEGRVILYVTRDPPRRSA